MTDPTNSLGPNVAPITIGAANDGQSENTLHFRTQDRGSTTAELLRGKLGQVKMMAQPRTAPVDVPSFRELTAPGAATQHIMGLLQRAT